MGDEGSVEVPVELARDVVGDVEQAGLRAGSAGGGQSHSGEGEAERGFHGTSKNKADEVSAVP